MNMTIQIKSVFGAIIKELDAETLRGVDLYGVDLYRVDLYRADLYGANLRGANLRGANLRGANLRDVDLSSANLSSANLSSANLRGANLRGANLRGVDLSSANLRSANFGSQWIIQGPCRSDGYWFFIQKLTGDKEPMIKAGCHYLTIQKACDHWQSTRGGTPLGDETMLILKFLEVTAKVRGLM